MSFRDAVSAFERELGRELSVRTIEPGQSVPGLPEAVIPVLAGLDAYDTPLDMTQLTSQHGVRPTTLAEFVHSFVTASRPPGG